MYNELVKRLRDWPKICIQYEGSVDQLHDEAADAIEGLQKVANNLLAKYEREATSMFYGYEGCSDFDYLQKEIKTLQMQINGKTEPPKEE